MITKTSGTAWTFDYVFADTDTEGDVDFSFISNDLAGNNTITNQADNGSVLLDRTLPTLTAVTIVSDNDYDNQSRMVG